MKKRRVFQPVPFLIVVSLLPACGSNRSEEQGTAETVSGVTLETIHLSAAPQMYEAVGTVRSANVSVLNAQIGGTVREIRVRAGDRVRSGQLLAAIDDRVPRAQVDAAQAGVQEAKEGLAEVEQAIEAATADRQFAEANYKRYQNLLAKNSLSRQEFEGAEAKYKAALANERALQAKKKGIEARNQQAQAQKSSAETMLSYSRIVSPIDGVVTQKSVDSGTVVMPGTPLLTVEDTSHYRLEASLPEEFLAKVKAGEETPVTTARGAIHGHVAEVVPASDPASRTFLVKVDIPSSCLCQSGEYATALFPVEETRIMSVPQSALVEHGELVGVYAANSRGAVEYRLVKTGKSTGDRVEIISGLNEGDRVAVTQVEKLRDGIRVEAQ
jgi:multidrug efflux pump subunit AcrA (membrane-fusion protein)